MTHFGIGVSTATTAVHETIELAGQADRPGLDLITVSDHPYRADRLDAYAEIGVLLGKTERIAGLVSVTNLPTRLGVTQLTPGQAVRASEESIRLVKLLGGGGEPVTFDGEFHHGMNLTPAQEEIPPVWTGSVGPKSLAVTGRVTDGWVPGHAADWLSERYRTSPSTTSPAASRRKRFRRPAATTGAGSVGR